jgi:hypothetical protein
MSQGRVPGTTLANHVCVWFDGLVAVPSPSTQGALDFCEDVPLGEVRKLPAGRCGVNLIHVEALSANAVDDFAIVAERVVGVLPPVKEGMLHLVHGTDATSALSIAINGLNSKRLNAGDNEFGVAFYTTPAVHVGLQYAYASSGGGRGGLVAVDRNMEQKQCFHHSRRRSRRPAQEAQPRQPRGARSGAALSLSTARTALRLSHRRMRQTTAVTSYT